jgi:hypothetical protein
MGPTVQPGVGEKGIIIQSDYHIFDLDDSLRGTIPVSPRTLRVGKRSSLNSSFVFVNWSAVDNAVSYLLEYSIDQLNWN